MIRVIFIAICSLVPPVAQAQKAYELFYYTGNAGHYHVELQYADGYPEGSSIILTDTVSHTTFTALPDPEATTDAKLILAHYNGDKKLPDYVTLMGMGSTSKAAPQQIHGSYTFKDASMPFILKKARK